MVFGQVTFYIFGVIFIASLALFIFSLVKIVKNPMANLNCKDIIKRLLLIGGIGALSLTIAGVGSYGFYKDVTPLVHEVIQAVLGGIVFSASIFVFFGSFMLHYYRKNLPETLDKWLYRILIISIPTLLVTFFVYTNGFAAYWEYPLPNGINFTEGFVTPLDSAKPNVAFYALAILSGALFVYFLCDHKMYKQYGKHGLLESTFFVAFPAGIIGARIFYVVGEWQDFVGREWWSIFAIWEGGLTILGGAITGIVVGVLWFIWKNRGYSIWVAVDVIVPTILIAQAIGRWGNFFNCEVHGLAVSESYFSWLPTLVLENSRYSSTSGWADPGMVYVPLFFIEGIFNMIGYLLLGELFSRKLRKYTELGDLAFGYVLWYGLVRTFMEPLRDPAYNMGEDGYWSYIWSIMFIAIGVLLIAGNHLVRYFIKRNKETFTPKKSWGKSGLIATIILATLGLAITITGVSLMLTGNFSPKLEFNQFNIGLISTVIGGSLIISLIIPIPYMIEGFKVQHE